MSGRIGIIVFVCAVVGAVPAAKAAPGDADGFDSHVRPFLVSHCLSCHSGAKPKGNVGLDGLSSDVADAAARRAGPP